MIRVILLSICLLVVCLGCEMSLSNSSSSSSSPTDNYQELVVLDPIRLDKNPRFISYQNPVYPRLAEQAGIEGIVWVKGLVAVEGKLKDVSVYTSSGTESLDEAAVEAAYKCKLIPGTRDMKLVPVWSKYKVEFVLEY